MKKRLSGPFYSVMNRYLKLRRSLGSPLKTDEYTLCSFDRYLAMHFPNVKRVTRHMVVGYLETTRHLQSMTRCHQLSCLRQFCRFLFQLNPKTYIPERTLLPPGRVNVRPHIYSEEELQRILRLTRCLKPLDSLRPHTFTTLISLLWVSGMRIGEAMRLNLEDVDLTSGVIHIQKTKFFKSRLVPLSPSTTQALSHYRNQRAQYGHDEDPRTPFFVNERARRCTPHTVRNTFLDLVRQAGIKTSQGGFPRLHDFRHTFATRWLSEFYHSGRDPTAYLPILATYLGHVSIASTQTYLHPSLEPLQTAAKQFCDHVNHARKERTKPL